jgi:hypothetical protein
MTGHFRPTYTPDLVDLPADLKLLEEQIEFAIYALFALIDAQRCTTCLL